MLNTAKRYVALLLVFCISVFAAPPAHADIAYTKDSKAIGVIVAVVVVGAAIGVGVYYAIHHGHSLKGCTAGSSSGLELITPGDNIHWALTGDTQGFKEDQLVRINGNRAKGGRKTFAVTKLAKNYGACPVTPSVAK